MMRYNKIFLALLLLVSLLFLAGCRRRAEEPPTTVVPAPQVEEVVSEKISAAAGGVITVTKEVSTYSAGVELVIPAGALRRDTEIKINDVVGEVSPPEGRVLLRRPIYLKPSGLVFRNPVTIRIPISEAVYTATRNSPELIALQRYDARQRRWHSIPIKKIQDRVIVAEISTFSMVSVDAPKRTRAEIVRELIQRHAETRARVTIGARDYYIVSLDSYIDPHSLKVVARHGPWVRVFVDTEWNLVADEETRKQLSTILLARSLSGMPGMPFELAVDRISAQINRYLTIVALEAVFVEASAALLTKGKSLKGTIVTTEMLDTIADPMNLVKMSVLADLWIAQASYRAFARLPEITTYSAARRFLRDFIRTEALHNAAFEFLTVEMIKVDRDAYWEIAADLAVGLGRRIAGAIKGIVRREAKVAITAEIAKDIEEIAGKVKHIPGVARYLNARPTDESVQHRLSQWVAASVARQYTLALYKATRMMDPDLTVTLVEAPASARVGDTISVAFTVRNQGGVPAPFNDRVSLSTAPHGAEILLGNFSMLLPPGAEIKRVVEVAIPPVRSGNYFLTVYTDSFKKISETNEGNNIRGTPISIAPLVPDPRLPIADAGPDQRVEVNTPVTLDGRESYDPNGDRLTFRWTQTAGPAVILIGRTTAHPTFIPTVAGTYIFQLVVSDGKLDSAPDEVTVTVTAPPLPNQPPTATITSPPAGATVAQGAAITFRGSATDPEDGTLTGASLVWTSNIAGQIGIGTSFTRTLSAGTHTIILTATDSEGATGTDSITVTIESIITPARGQIAFVSSRDGNWEIYVMNADGTNLRNITNHPASRDPAWSPDGTKIAFASDRDGNWEIYVMNVDGTNLRRLTNHSRLDWNPTWSPDGTKIAFTSNRDGVRYAETYETEIYVMNADGTNLRNITNHPALDRDPTWSPDGTKIAFTSNRDADWRNRAYAWEIYVMNADGTNLRNITNHPAWDKNPAWSPDGTKIAFVSSRADHNWEIYVMNADGTNLRNITNHPRSDKNPAWSPDGTRIAFQSNRDGNWEIYVMNADGTNQRRLTNHPAWDWGPAWSPVLP